MMYRVTKKYLRGSAVSVGEFADKDEAMTFITAKLDEDFKYKVNASYQLYQGALLMQEFAAIENADQAVGPDADSGQQPSSTQTFNPTPFNMAPRPGGLPHNWVKDSDKKEDEK